MPFLERSKLYKDVWPRPCTKIAAELGISSSVDRLPFGDWDDKSVLTPLSALVDSPPHGKTEKESERRCVWQRQESRATHPEVQHGADHVGARFRAHDQDDSQNHRV